MSRKWTRCNSDDEWSRRVRELSDGYCSWPGCSSNWGMSAHHVIDRTDSTLRLILENGVYLCAKHHGLIQTSVPSMRDEMSKILVGDETYADLMELQNASKQKKEAHVRMPSSSDLNIL